MNEIDGVDYQNKARVSQRAAMLICRGNTVRGIVQAIEDDGAKRKMFAESEALLCKGYHVLGNATRVARISQFQTHKNKPLTAGIRNIVRNQPGQAQKGPVVLNQLLAAYADSMPRSQPAYESTRGCANLMVVLSDDEKITMLQAVGMRKGVAQW